MRPKDERATERDNPDFSADENPRGSTAWISIQISEN